MHHSDSSIIIDLKYSSLRYHLLNKRRHNPHKYINFNLSKPKELLQRMRDELGDGGTLLIILVSFILFYQISYLYLQNIL